MDFVSLQEFRSIRNEDEGVTLFNQVLTRVYNKAVEDTIRKLPEVIGSLSGHMDAIAKMKTQFYKDNSDLAEHKDIVIKAIEEIERNNPGLPYEKILERVAPRAKELLKLTLKNNSVPPSKSPGIPKLSLDTDGDNGVL